MHGHIFFVFIYVLGLVCCLGMVRRQQASVDRIARGLNCDRLDGSWITGQKGKSYRTFFPFQASVTIVMGVIILVTNGVYKKI